jgi:DNA-binding transcriptional LysR family regulator
LTEAARSFTKGETGEDRTMLTKGVTLRGLEVFEALARTGSVAQASDLTGLSQPAVSQQMRNLETALGIDLVDHGRRPMRLTPAGRSFLTRTEAVLSELRLAQSELTVMDLTHLSTLSIGLIDDFDNDLTPRLATILADSLTGCRFSLITAPSNDIIEAMQKRLLNVAVSASSGKVLDGVTEYPLVRDPFILVMPKGSAGGSAGSPGDVLPLLGSMPMLRYSREQLIARQIAAHLARHKMEYEDRFQIGSHLALMAMVARRIGWALTTPLGYMRAVRFHDDIDALPLPFAAFSRTISLFAAADWADRVPRDIAQTVRHLVQNQMIDPAITRLPWLAGKLQVIDA